MSYNEPLIISISTDELSELVNAGACSSGYVCIESFFSCNYLQWAQDRCPVYDSSKFDPLSAPGGAHGTYY